LRQELALAYVQNLGLSLADISYLLGFSEQSAFHRAFKRWTGLPPGTYRRTIQAAPGNRLSR
jgi:AraC-like DNA-binding protein